MSSAIDGNNNKKEQVLPKPNLMVESGIKEGPGALLSTTSTSSTSINMPPVLTNQPEQDVGCSITTTRATATTNIGEKRAAPVKIGDESPETSDHATKRIKLEPEVGAEKSTSVPVLPTASATLESDTNPPAVAINAPPAIKKEPATATPVAAPATSSALLSKPPPLQAASISSTCSSSSSNDTLTQPPPSKATKMLHLHRKYHAELEYMLREFRKLERQLLGAKGNGIEESSGSRERREKLHSFILHLQDTIRQIEAKCDAADEEDPENVAKLEEHILANLLPVKVRLTKQLAAQQGATRNPVGMPRRGSSAAPAVPKQKGTTFAAAAERKLAAAAAQEQQQQATASAASSGSSTQYGKPLGGGGGSSLTQKLHGATLGSSSQAREASAEGESSRKILYAGMAPGSTQVQSGVSAAAGVHKMIIDTPSLKPKLQMTTKVGTTEAATTAKPTKALSSSSSNNNKNSDATKSQQRRRRPQDDPNLTEEERKKWRKERRKRKKLRALRRKEKERQRQLFLQQQQQEAAVAQQQQQQKGPATGPPKAKVPKAPAAAIVKNNKKKGPRSVEYICALCSEAYASTCEFNPWWALTSHECPKCRKTQVPRIDIASPANTIEYHPALLAHADEGGGGGGGANIAPPPANMNTMHVKPAHIQGFPAVGNTPAKLPSMFPLSDTEDESDLSELSEGGELSQDSDDSDSDVDDDDEIQLTEGELAELEGFGKEYEGPKLTPEQSSRLMVLMGHAQTCPGRHKSVKHRDVCNSVKYLMLHVRDCPGTTSTYDVCPFPWCRKVKHLMYHLIACPRPKDCAICSPMTLSSNLCQVIGLNNYRRKKQRERIKAAMAAAAAAAKAKPPPPKPVTTSSSKPIKPTTYNNNRASVAKKPAKQYGKSTAKATAMIRSSAPSRTLIKSSRAKPTNGVVVKSLIKPLNKSSMVVVKNRSSRQEESITKKPVVASIKELIPIQQQPQKVDAVTKACAAAQAALAVSALEHAAKVAMNEAAAVQIEVNEDGKATAMQTTNDFDATGALKDDSAPATTDPVPTTATTTAATTNASDDATSATEARTNSKMETEQSTDVSMETTGKKVPVTCSSSSSNDSSMLIENSSKEESATTPASPAPPQFPAVPAAVVDEPSSSSPKEVPAV